ncbi:DUF2769 domain-containing protein [Methanobacterium subterraneum]|uniref:DUF2769 domain-containing protein n=1 Tax=Methanobacterium subterraneum TaxID=59277 RepID=A0A7K4DKI7_9EURY|nr:DUF2769 domain-containing protein [Methanobacterium subterraneum]NMO08394.1 DUF2769 domain-containing protein [Methanobacterium subterraneum]PKL73846.1 MAG: hypothetical protein CVV29_01270 [Methanobacteriales archaeon HGW-Methanobacteriales-2]
MDAFKKLIDKLNHLDGEKRLKTLEELEGDCVCPICPSYNDCAKEKDENVFCITGKSEGCINMELGCLCPTCPLAQKYQIGMMNNFYCHRGSETEQK